MSHITLKKARELRELRGCSLEEVAEYYGITIEAASKIESELKQAPFNIIVKPIYINEVPKVFIKRDSSCSHFAHGIM